MNRTLLLSLVAFLLLTGCASLRPAPETSDQFCTRTAATWAEKPNPPNQPVEHESGWKAVAEPLGFLFNVTPLGIVASGAGLAVRGIVYGSELAIGAVGAAAGAKSGDDAKSGDAADGYAKCMAHEAAVAARAEQPQ
jgi:hypothetical protein